MHSTNKYELIDPNWENTDIKFTKEDEKKICTQEDLLEFIEKSGGKIEIERLIEDGLIQKYQSNTKSNPKK